jgi:acyl-CoA reductase-like NAD-dependent aldehyde dehydrogenase
MSLVAVAGKDGGPGGYEIRQEQTTMQTKSLHSWIDGAAQVNGADGTVAELRSPWSRETVAIVRGAGLAGVDQAVASARRAFLAARKTSAAQRAEWLTAAAAEIERVAEDIIASAVTVIGKPRRAARFEAQRSAQFLRACAAQLAAFGGEVLPLDAAKMGAGLFGFALRVPHGVIGAITPFNAPANLLVQKVAPALAVGNAIVAKPAPEGLEIALIIAACFAKAGLPNGLFNIIAGGTEEALAVAAHPDVALVTVTGGTTAGQALAAAAGAKPFVAELGGNSANLVCQDADLSDAAARIVPSAFEASGQQCISAQRIIVEATVLDRFVDLFVAAAQRLKTGDPADDATDLGPVVNERAAERIMSLIAEAVQAGGKLILPPRRDGCLITPAIILSPPESVCAVRDEIFGPVAVILAASDLDDAIRLANDSEFGLQASCFTSSLETAFRISEELRSGSVWINEGSRFRLDNYPFGGSGGSGYGREGIRYAMEEFTQWKFTGMRFPGRATW